MTAGCNKPSDVSLATTTEVAITTTTVVNITSGKSTNSDVTTTNAVGGSVTTASYELGEDEIDAGDFSGVTTTSGEMIKTTTLVATSVTTTKAQMSSNSVITTTRGTVTTTRGTVTTTTQALQNNNGWQDFV